jgi:hypothetical protein
LYQGTASQAAEKLVSAGDSYQGMTSQLAEKLVSTNDSYQGTTSVVPQRVENRSWALAPALLSTQNLALHWSFSAPLLSCGKLACARVLKGHGFSRAAKPFVLDLPRGL